MNYTKILIASLITLALAACGQEEETKVPASSTGNTLETAKKAEEKADEDAEKAAKAAAEEKARKVAEEKKVAKLAKPKYVLNEADWSFKPIAGAPAKVVLLTIDDAPDKHALQMAKTLKELNAPAIFFVNGHFLNTDAEKAVLKEIHEMGFAIGNHTQTHAKLKDLTEEEQRAEILEVNRIVESVIGEKPKFFRAPFGSNTDFSRALAKEEGMLLMNWTYGYDWEKDYQDPAALTNIMLNTQYLTNGANLLMHDRKWTADALKGIVEGLRAKGYGMIDPSTIQGIDVE